MKNRQEILMLIMGLALFFASFFLHAQKKTSSVLNLQRSKDAIKIDGKLDEQGWIHAMTAAHFTQTFPTDTLPANAKTEVKLLWDEKFLYIGAVLWQQKNDYVVTSLRRDFGRTGTDYFSVILDPFGDKLNGFHFAVSPMNVQWDALISDGDKLSTEWDNKWFSKVTNHDSFWTVEMAIPFTTLRYKKTTELAKWGINFSRYQVSTNEISTWQRVPFEFSRNNLTFAGTLQWDKALPTPGKNISLIPFVTVQGNESKINNESFSSSGSAGLDAKIAVSTSLNLDLTINPDFSQVEVDRQVTNLNRFQLFFPERRQFFLENSDLLGSLGLSDIRPFFSRRLGIETDASTGLARNVPILYGARLSGRINKDWRISFMNLQTGKDEASQQPSFMHTALAVQRRLGTRSSITSLITSKNSLDKKVAAEEKLGGLEYRYLSTNNRWQGRLFYHQHLSEGKWANPNHTAANAMGGLFSYTDMRQSYEVGSNYVSATFNPKMGFIPRRDYVSNTVFLSRSFFPKASAVKKKLSNVTIGISNVINTGTNGSLQDRSHEAYVAFIYNNSAVLETVLRYQDIRLLDPFDPTNTGGIELAAGTRHRFLESFTAFSSNIAKPFGYSLQLGGGGYYNGNRFNFSSKMSYRFQPYGTISVDVNVFRIQLPKPYTSTTLVLAGPKLDLTFTNQFFLAVFVQYNNQIQNININTRLQWRYQPASDLFLVYTDNYFPNGFLSKNRALVLKVNHWFNL